MALSTKQAPAGQLKRPHFHLVWKPAGQPNASWKWQLFGYYWRETPRRLHVVLSLRGMAVWAASLSFAAYLIAAAVLVAIWDRSPYNQVGYLDVVLPTRWSDLRALRGKGLIAEGIAEIRAKRYATGIMRLTQGVARNPKDFTGRLELARIYVALGQLHRAQDFLIEGLDLGTPPRAYRDTLLALTAYMADHEKVLALVARLERSADAESQRQMLSWKASALEKLERVADLNELRQRLRATTPSIAVEAAWARTQLAAGAPKIALAELRRDRARFGTPVEGLELELKLAAASHDLAVVDEAVAAWLKLDSAGAVPRAREIVARITLEQTELARERIRQYFLHFGDNAPSAQLLFRVLFRETDVNWVRFAFGEAEAAGTVSIPVRMTWVEALMNAGEFVEAARQLSITRKAIVTEKFADRDWSIGTQRVIDCITAPTPSTESSLVDFFAEHRLTPDAYLFAWRTLLRAKSPIAFKFSGIANNRFPALRLGESNAEQAVLTTIKLPVAEPPLPKAVATAPTPTTPQTTNAEEAAKALPTEGHARNELKRIDGFIAVHDWDRAFEALQTVERANFDVLRGECAWRRLQIHGERAELFQLTSAARIYLRSPAANQTALRTLAERWSDRRHRESLLALLRETARQFPAATWAALKLKNAESELIVAPDDNITLPQK
ncbi:MAG: hypothetical protein HYV96_18095 [Opitutae bacterium]|nr:hypothetical protein [Opitutae bacterium]